MGSVVSEEERGKRVRDEVERNVGKFKSCPDLAVDRTIVMFCSSSSSDVLQQHLNNRKQMNRSAADWTKTLTEKLANLSPNPRLAGLGALAAAVFIDSISDSSSTEGTKEALRCVFAEEKASEVWDQIDECLKRCVININDVNELRRDIKRIESQLSFAITKLRNSMVKDGHMTSPALKAWVNGAAFHVQMLIHLVRLGGIQTCDPVETLLSAYQSDLDLLFEKHKAATEKKCKLGCDNLEDCPRPYFESEEGEVCSVPLFVRFEDVFQAYYEKHYGSQESEIRTYFRTVTDDLRSLLSQSGSPQHLLIQD